MEKFLDMEFSILNWIQSTFKSDFADTFMSLITKLGDAGIFWIICAVICLCFKKTRKMGLTMGLALIFGLILGNGFMKNVFFRQRPYTYEGYEAIRQNLLVKELSDGSFPSGHTLASFEAATAVFIYKKPLGTVALILAALIAFSRLYLFVHFPSDVFAGLIFGVCFAIASYLIIKVLYKKYDLENKLLLAYEKK